MEYLNPDTIPFFFKIRIVPLMLTLETIVEIRVHLPLAVLRKSNDEIQHYPSRRSLCLYLSSAHVYSCVSFSASPDREWQAMTNGKVNIGLPKILGTGVIHIQYLAEDALYCRTMLV